MSSDLLLEVFGVLVTTPLIVVWWIGMLLVGKEMLDDAKKLKKGK